MGEPVIEDYFPEYVDHESIHFIIKGSDLDTEIDTLFQQLNIIEQGNKLNLKKQELINSYNKNSSHYDKQEIQ